MKVSIEGQVYDYDQSRLLMSEARLLKSLTGLTPPKWNAALAEFDPDAIAFLIYLLKVRAGENVDWTTLDCDLGTLDLESDGDGEDTTGDPSRADADG